MEIDWAEISRLLVAFLGGGVGGSIITTYFGHYLTLSRDKNREERHEKRKLKTVSEIEYLGGTGSLPMSLHFVITAINDGFRPITIDKVGLILEDADGLTMQFGNSSDHEPWPSLPKILKDREAVKFFMDMEFLIATAELIGNYTPSKSGRWEITSFFVRDAEGNEYIEMLTQSQRTMIDKVISEEIPLRVKKSSD